MKFKLNKGTNVYIGMTPLTLTEDTEFLVDANSIDEVAEKLWSAGARAFGEHLSALKHRDTKKKMIDGVEHEVDIIVSYGAGGARVETEMENSQPRRVGGPSQQGTASARGGVGTETVPGASGTGEAAKARNRALRGNADVNDEEEPRKDGSDETLESLPSKQDIEGDLDERPASVPRTEFVVPPKRFPDEVQTPTDPPLSEVVAQSPARAVPFVGEFDRTGAFQRQGAVGDRVNTEGRPNPSPDTPGTRDRQLPAPSETDKETPDETAKNLARAQEEGQKSSDKAPDDDKVAPDHGHREDDGEDGADDGATVDDELPEDFPHRAVLEEADITKLSQLEGMGDEELQEIPQIGPARADEIRKAARKAAKKSAKKSN